MNSGTYLGGKAEISIGAITIGPEFLTEITPNMQEGTRTTESLAGTITRPSGTFETAEITGQFIVPSMDALKRIFPAAYQAAEGEGLSGRVVFGSNTCQTQQALPVNIHYTCEDNSDNDLHFYAALVQMTFNPSYNATDNLTVGFTLLPQPTENGYGFAGAGSLTQKTLWDAATMSFKPVAES